ncbi:MAG: response regulator [Nitrospirae bacterium]|nr:response regulator [Nitrospirota bacterium]
MNRTILEGLLVQSGYTVILSDSGGAAIEIIHRQKIDLVLLDVSMPDISGFEVCKSIKGDERYQNIPVVLVTGLTSKEERIKGIEAGAEDFISKPFDQTELLTRIKMLLKMKDLRGDLDSAYDKIKDLTGFGKKMAMSFDPLNFNFISSFDDIVNNVIRRTVEAPDKPRMVIVGFIDEKGEWQWYLFESLPAGKNRTWLKLDIHDSLNLPRKTDTGGSKTFIYNNDDLSDAAIWPFILKLEQIPVKVSNVVCFIEHSFAILALNYDKQVSRYDAEVLNSIAMQSLFMKSLATQVRETEHAFDYLVRALARASEANDEDTGNHILRVGEYCAVIAKELGMSETFINGIRVQATLHDVGKIHVHPDILKKAGKLTPDEYETMKSHTIFGAKILGDHVRLALAKKLVLSHHERWDGSGYPYGLKGDQIPLEGRIMNIADQYDALRNARVYKPTIGHNTTYGIITEGDGRTQPHHFDPQVLSAFKDTAAHFENIYEKMKG